MGGKAKTVTKKMMVKELEIHPLAQREVVNANLKRIKAAFNPELVGSIDVVQYEHRGKFRTFVIDGQHRVRAMMDLGLGDYAVDVLIHTTVTNDEQACEFFLGKDQRSSIRPYDKFIIEGRAGHPDVLGIYAIAKDLGINIASTKAASTVCAVTSLKAIYRLDSGASLRKALGAVSSAWGRKAASFDGKLIEGVGYLFHRFNGQIDETSMIEQLARFPGGPNAVVGDAKGLRTLVKGNSAKCIATVIANHYNARKRVNKLEL